MVLDLSRRLIPARPPLAGGLTGAGKLDQIKGIRVSHVRVPIAVPVSDAKVLTGRQRPLTHVEICLAEVVSEGGHRGHGFSYTLRTGGPGMYATACELAPLLIGEDPLDIARLWDKLAWQAISLGRGGMSYQAICAFDTALYDLKARRAGLPLSKLLGAHHEAVPVYNSSGQYLQASISQMVESARASVESGIGGIKMKVGQPDGHEDLKRVDALREHLPDHITLMIDANQQWDRAYALQFGRIVDGMGLGFIEEPLDAWDFDGHAELARNLATPVATGEMLTSPQEVQGLMAAGIDTLQADLCRIGGYTPFLKVMAEAETRGLTLAPHFVMEHHIHATAAYPSPGWVEHFEWLEGLFEERLELQGGRMIVPTRPGNGFTLSGQARDWTESSQTFGDTHGI